MLAETRAGLFRHCAGQRCPRAPPTWVGRAGQLAFMAPPWWSHPRFRAGLKHSTNTMKAYRHMPMLKVEDVFDARPFNTAAVAVDMLEGATPLPEFKHPERAFYIFGAEDATLGARITDKCQFTVMVPARYCMNLAACVNVVLYDRMAKIWNGEGEGDEL